MPEAPDIHPLQPGTRLAWIGWGVDDSSGEPSVRLRAGRGGCLELLIGQEFGPMGHYSVVVEVRDDGPPFRHVLHYVTSYELAK